MAFSTCHGLACLTQHTRAFSLSQARSRASPEWVNLILRPVAVRLRRIRSSLPSKQPIDLLSGFVFRACWAQCGLDASPACDEFLLFDVFRRKSIATAPRLYNFYVVIWVSIIFFCTHICTQTCARSSRAKVLVYCPCIRRELLSLDIIR